ncbi:MAG: ORC1-type DNA replication protein [Euryarchaeota archaeon]|nr:ORC1-type DNA replication protein [Euryarchaeota archaeon]
MKQRNLEELFDRCINKKMIIKNKDMLRHTYTPEVLPHRDVQVENLVLPMVSTLKGETPSNVLIYGKTGTGKTAVVKHVGNALVKRVGGKFYSSSYAGKRKPSFEKGSNGNTPIYCIYINCEVVDTQYRMLAKLCEYLGESVPLTGWPTDKVYDTFFNALEDSERLVIIVLDEIDRLLKKSSEDILYNLTRMNSDLKNAKICIIGISNDLKFIEFLDPRIKSSLGEEELIFPPYNAVQLVDILTQRISEAFYPDTVNSGVIQLCAALAAQEHGDARRALDLLRTSAELAERSNAKTVKERHVKEAKVRIESDRVIEVLRTLPTQSKFVLYSVVLLEQYNTSTIITGDVYSVYKDLCRLTDQDVLTQRRISDLVSELDMLGIINARIVNKGRYGRTKEIKLGSPMNQIKTKLEEDYKIERVSSYVPSVQHKLG